jgi:hypothetical protein
MTPASTMGRMMRLLAPESFMKMTPGIKQYDHPRHWNRQTKISVLSLKVTQNMSLTRLQSTKRNGKTKGIWELPTKKPHQVTVATLR